MLEREGLTALNPGSAVRLWPGVQGGGLEVARSEEQAGRLLGEPVGLAVLAVQGPRCLGGRPGPPGNAEEGACQWRGGGKSGGTAVLSLGRRKGSVGIQNWSDFRARDIIHTYVRPPAGCGRDSTLLPCYVGSLKAVNGLVSLGQGLPTSEL